MTEHPPYHAQIVRLNRIGGQVSGVRKMIEDGRYCPEILAQLRALRAAIRRVESDILEAHLQHCVTDALNSQDKIQAAEKIAELKALFQRFDEG